MRNGIGDSKNPPNDEERKNGNNLCRYAQAQNGMMGGLGTPVTPFFNVEEKSQSKSDLPFTGSKENNIEDTGAGKELMSVISKLFSGTPQVENARINEKQCPQGMGIGI